jgi:hypothetical protein|tara:strand:+ start:1541 stop:1918 length:378 start_codon:yes stop_codon:yes gene_type:complete
MQTYQEQQRGTETDWNEFLNRPKRSELEWQSKAETASSWVTCACGNQCAIIPRVFSDGGKPEDRALAKLGMQFYRQVNARKRKAAIETLRKIEIRSAQLIHDSVINAVKELNDKIKGTGYKVSLK